jgi:hypothetical protein
MGMKVSLNGKRKQSMFTVLTEKFELFEVELQLNQITHLDL